MGMSASQARLLSLTARQSNLEFEGQQINQQRTNLSDQSANYYNSLLSITVPTPPSTDDYTKVQYTFTIGGNNANVSQVLPQDNNGNYLVSYTTNLSTIGIQSNSAYKVTATSNSSTSKKGTSTQLLAGSGDAYKNAAYSESSNYYIKTYREDDQNGTLISMTKSSSNYDKDRLSDATYYDANGYQVDGSIALASGDLKAGYTALVKKNDGEEGTTYSTADIQLSDKSSFDTAKTNNETINQFTENTDASPSGTDKITTMEAANSADFETVADDYKEAFTNSGLNPNDYYQYTSSSGVRFALKTDVAQSANNSTSTVTTYAVASMTTNQTTTMDNAQVQFDSTGRISTITDEKGNSYTMTANTETDNDAYEDAYNKYTYDQYVYDQEQNNINSHIKILQEQDKNLELRLSQLNTEHEAIQTEIDAVNKVLSKNIETSFKTFNA